MRKSALVVDDNDINIKIISALLGAFGLDCAKAASGAEAIELVKYFETKKSGEPGFSFILVDHLMYGMDGIETTKKICEISKIPVYGMSGSITDQLVDAFKAAGAVDAFPKPVTPGTIHKVLCGCLEEGDYILPKDLLAKISIGSLPLPNYWQKNILVWASNSTTAVLEAAMLGLPVACMQSGRDFDLSPIQNIPGLVRTASLADVKTMLATAAPLNIDEDYLCLDPLLSRTAHLLFAEKEK